MNDGAKSLYRSQIVVFVNIFKIINMKLVYAMQHYIRNKHLDSV